jgi:deazaflavin-dependent oxidoreductase (nitroreductase family)
LLPLRRAFRLLNRWFTVPVIRHGLGPLLGTPMTGSILLLRTRGRRTGLIREAPLGYAVLDGRVVVIAGYGTGTHWLLNALAEPQVEMVLPGATLAGRAELVRDPGQRRDAFRAAIAAMGVVGRVTVGDLGRASDERIDELSAALPVLAITPTGVRSGPYDPGGSFWRIPLAATAAGVVALWCRRRERSARMNLGAGAAPSGSLRLRQVTARLLGSRQHGRRPGLLRR